MTTTKIDTTIKSKDYAGRWLTLTYVDTGTPVKHLDAVIDFRGNPARIIGGRAPHKPSSQGRVWTEDGGELYPSVFGLVWR